VLGVSLPYQQLVDESLCAVVGDRNSIRNRDAELSYAFLVHHESLNRKNLLAFCVLVLRYDYGPHDLHRGNLLNH
jgi:hypothetical protein